MSTVALTISYRYSLDDDANTRLRMWTSETENIPSEVFLHRRVREVAAVSASDEYERVVTYADMVNYPTIPGDGLLFRKASVDMLYASRYEAASAHDAASAAASALVDEIVDIYAASAEETVEIL